MATDWRRLLAAGQEKVIAHYRRLIASSKDENERGMLQRQMFKHECELLELLSEDGPDQAKAA
jgi:hypothetical protein